MAKSIKDLNLKGRKVFIRVDFNVPLKDGVVTDDTRIVEAMKTIEFARSAGAKVILASHLGRPKGDKVPSMSLKPVAEYISDKFFPISFIDDCIGDDVVRAADSLSEGDVLLLENLRYYKGEEKDFPEFVEELTKIADVYVNDAFGTCHREHASVYGLPAKMAEKGAGFLVEKEIAYFEKLLKNPDKPFAAVLGGAKVSDKIGVIQSLMKLADKIFIGGAMAYTFLKYMGKSTGTSLVEEDQMDTVKDILAAAEKSGVKIILPVDHVISNEFGGAPTACDGVDIPEGFMGLDIGAKSIELYISEISDCKTVLWNGPMGVFENPDYAKGTFALADTLGASDATVVVGGGDSVSAVKKAGIADKIDHISTGGGASLEYLEFGKLPGIEILG